MFKNLRAILTGGVVGAGVGALFGALTWGVESVFGFPGFEALLNVARNGAVFGCLAGLGFSTALASLARVDLARRLDVRGFTTLGAVISPVAFITLLAVWGPALSNYGLVDWIGIVGIYGLLGAGAGRLLGGIAMRGGSAIGRDDDQALDLVAAPPVPTTVLLDAYQQHAKVRRTRDSSA